MIALLALAAAWGWGTESFDGWPPMRFRHGRVAATVYFEQHRNIAANCGGDGPGDLTVVACSDNGPNVMFLPNPCDWPKSDDYAKVVCHELGHERGWAGNHPR